MGVGSSTSISAEKKLSLQLLSPLAGEERDSGDRTMGVGLNKRALKDLDFRRKNFRCGPPKRD
jgi:hypothetical protein